MTEYGGDSVVIDTFGARYDGIIRGRDSTGTIVNTGA